jgi:hypothetical protein
VRDFSMADRSTDRFPWTSLTVLYVVSRILIHHVRPFVYETLAYDMHFLDPGWLKHDLLRSIWYMHMQPPLFNLGVGLVLKLAPTGYEAMTFATLYMAIGFGIVALAFDLVERVTGNRALGWAVALLLLIWPSMIQAETWFYYTYPVTLCLIGAAWTLERWTSQKVSGLGVLYMTLLGITVLLRSAFHLVLWMIPLVIVPLWHAAWERFPKRGPVILAATFWIFCGTVVYARNAMQYGMFASSTWFGFSLKAVTAYLFYADHDRLDMLIASGRVPPIAAVERFSSVETYRPFHPELKPTGIEALDSPIRPNTAHPDGRPAINYNNAIYPLISRDYVRSSPPVLALGFLVAVVVLWRSPWRESPVYFYLLFNLLYVTLLSIGIELGEGNYLRIPIDPLVIVSLAMAL